MGYACPVCEAPQRDAEHLAHHLAFTAMLHGGGHEAWLDDHVPGWTDDGPDELGERVAPRAAEATYEEVFEDTVHDADPDRPFADRAAPRGNDAGVAPALAPDSVGADGRTDETTRAALAEARELTRRMYRNDDQEEDGTRGVGEDGDEDGDGSTDASGRRETGDDSGNPDDGEEKA